MEKGTRKSILIMLAVIIFILCSCSNTNQISDLSNDNASARSETAAPYYADSEMEDIPDSVENMESTHSVQSLFSTEYIPVACSNDRFIVRNESGNLYGLIGRDGTPIMPCKYEKIQFQQTKNEIVLEVMSKGSYGVFDLDGVELLPCEYTNIRFSSYEDACIVKTFLEKEGLLDLTGATILPIEFDKIAFGYGKIIAAGTAASEQETGSIVAYSSDGQVIKEFPWEKSIADMVVGNGGNLLSINYWAGSNRLNIEYLAIEGYALWDETRVVGNNLFYFQNGVLHIRDMYTQQEVSVWEFPEGQNIVQSDIRTADTYIDPMTGVESVDLFVVGVTDDRPQGKGYDLRVTFGEQIDVINYDTLDIMSTILSRRANLGEFCNGIAIAVPQNGYLYTINTKGEKLEEIQEPYTDCMLLKNAVVLNNHGFYSIVDSAGNTLLSEDGYSSVKAVNVSGLYLVTDQNGQLGLINDYAEEIAPCGSIETLESVIHRPQMDTWKLESSHNTEDELYLINYNDTWGLYSASSHRFLTASVEIIGDDAQYSCISGNNGYALINEENDTVYLISYDGDAYTVYPYATINDA